MSVAFDLDSLSGPSPVPARRPRLRVVTREAQVLARPEAPRLASVSVLHAPSPSAVSAPLRLTRRGAAVLAVLTAAVGAALVWAATLSAPQTAAGPAASVPATVTVRAGDTLWALASRVAPDRDPRAEVADLRRLNHLTDSAVTPGQSLRVR
jgi:LysM repeat protein